MGTTQLTAKYFSTYELNSLYGLAPDVGKIRYTVSVLRREHMNTRKLLGMEVLLASLLVLTILNISQRTRRMTARDQAQNQDSS